MHVPVDMLLTFFFKYNMLYKWLGLDRRRGRDNCFFPEMCGRRKIVFQNLQNSALERFILWGFMDKIETWSTVGLPDEKLQLAGPSPLSKFCKHLRLL